MAFIPGQTTPARPRRSLLRRTIVIVAVCGALLAGVAAAAFHHFAPQSIEPATTSSRSASDEAANSSARANLETAIAEARAVLSSIDTDTPSAMKLAEAVADCTEVSSDQSISTAELQGCELDVRTAAATAR
tara:strand:- start:36321 stop:36716 length:396 start_codon:yes stop_codon:yes gene_type:complete